jgi:hypothetical protein
MKAFTVQFLDISTPLANASPLSAGAFLSKTIHKPARFGRNPHFYRCHIDTWQLLKK